MYELYIDLVSNEHETLRLSGGFDFNAGSISHLGEKRARLIMDYTCYRAQSLGYLNTWLSSRAP